jgi:hypothetical protein
MSDTIPVAERNPSSQHVRSASWFRRRHSVPDQERCRRCRCRGHGSMLGDRLYRICQVRFQLPREILLHSTFEVRHGNTVEIQFPIKKDVPDVDAEVMVACSETASIGYVRYNSSCREKSFFTARSKRVMVTLLTFSSRSRKISQTLMQRSW